MDLSYILNELGEERENYFNAIAPPIVQTTNFSFEVTICHHIHYFFSRTINLHSGVGKFSILVYERILHISKF